VLSIFGPIRKEAVLKCSICSDLSGRNKMYENLHDFEQLFHDRRNELERDLEECRKLKASRIRKEIKENYNKLFMLLLTFRNINK